MSLQNLTIKSQERIQHAQQLAFNNNNVNIETEHLLQSLLDDKDSAIEFLLKKNNVNINFVETKLTDSIVKLAKISGGEPAQNVSRDMNTVLLRASAV
jgi:ATP-dependent Clp protease ATP-binding subunit ClpB